MQLSIFEQRARVCLSDLRQDFVQAFWVFHEANPHVWELFKRYAFEVKRTGRPRYSVQAIFERIRWHVAIETRGDDFKINNNYRACYARLLILEHPEFAGFFVTREGGRRAS